jgi:hypothetical protein
LAEWEEDRRMLAERVERGLARGTSFRPRPAILESGAERAGHLTKTAAQLRFECIPGEITYAASRSGWGELRVTGGQA